MHSTSYFLKIGMVLCFLASGLGKLQAQKAEEIGFLRNQNPSQKKLICTGNQFAGTFQMGAINALSNDLQGNRKFLCREDEFNVVHNGNAVFDGDPNPATSPGIGYGWYRCPPDAVISGMDDLADIITDPCIFDLVNNPPMGIFIYTDAQNGDALFRNVLFQQSNGSFETIPDFYNNGDPIEIWFAPITYDSMDPVTTSALYENNGSCVDVNVDAAFSIVYLNQVEINNFTPNIGGDPLMASFVPTGGVSEFDGSSYQTINIFETANPANMATSITGTQAHDGTVNFTVASQGVYTIEVIDEKGCPATFETLIGAEPIELIMGGCDTLQFMNSQPGDQFCLPMIVNNFENVLAISLSVLWDASVLEFQSIQNIGSSVIGMNSFGTVFPNAVTLIEGNFPLATGESLPDGTVLFEICFEIVGVPGNSTTVSIGNFGQLDVELVTVESGNNGMPFPFTLQQDLCEINITPATDLTAYLSSCGGPVNGEINFQIFGGTGPYSYTYVENGNPGNNGNGNIPGNNGSAPVSPGTYTVTVTDDVGASQMYTIDVGNTVLNLTDSTAFVSPTCFDFTNGQIIVEPNNGVAPYSFVVQDLINLGAPSFSGFILNEGDSRLIPSLPASNYLIDVTDANGCNAFMNINLDIQEFIITTINETPASCLGVPNGGITLDISGPADLFPGGEYQFDFPDRNIFGAPTSNRQFAISLLEPGEYEVTFYSNVAGCDTTYTFTIGTNEITSGNLIPMAETCAGAENGEVEVTGTTNGAAGGSFNFEFLDSMNNLVAVLGPSGNVTYSNLASGNYSVIVSNAGNGCLSDTLPFFIGPGSMLDISTDSVIYDNCLPQIETGAIAFNINGGMAPYLLDAGPTNGFQNGNSLEQIGAGNYVLTVTDANSCTGTQAFTIETYEDVGDEIIGFEVDGSLCAGGTVTVFYLGEPVDPNEYGIIWDLNAVQIGTDASVMITEPGILAVSIFDTDNFCIPFRDTIVECDDVFGISIAVTDPICNISALPGGVTTGNVLIDTVNAAGPVTYFWSFPDTTNSGIYTDIDPGTYYVTVTDGDTVVMDSFVIIDPAPINMVFGGIDETSCFENCDGEVDITPLNVDDPNTDYILFWTSDGVMFSDTALVISATGLCQGDNIFTATQDGQCFYNDTIDIPGPDSLTINLIDSSDISCFGLTDGMLTVGANGGTPGYNFEWEFNNEMSNQLNGLAAGTYVVSLTDGNNCVAIDSFEVNEPDSISLSIDSLNTSVLGCNGQEGAIFTLTAGGSGMNTYTWSPDVSNGASATGLTGGMYMITVTDVNGCTDTTSFNVTSPPPILFTLDTIMLPLCAGDDAIVTVDSAYGGSGSGFTFSVQNGPALAIGTSAPIPAGEFLIEVFDSTGCSADTIIMISDPNPIIIDIDPDSTTIDLGNSTEMTVLVLDSDNPIATFDWIPGIPLLDCDTCQTVNTFQLFEDQIFTAIATDTSGCTGEANATVLVNTNRRVFIPNVFTPNNDGLNEIFRVYSAGLAVREILTFEVFDRWGNQVFKDQNVTPNETGSEGWNGQFRNDGLPMEPGVYTYLIIVSFADRPDDPLKYRGNVTLLR